VRQQHYSISDSTYTLNDERKHSVTRQDSKTSRVSLLSREAWSGGHYELSILLGERDHDRASSAVRVLWSYPLIDGPYASKQDLSETQHRVDPTEALERGLYGLASLTPEIRVPCGSTLIRFDDGPDWIQLYLPLGSISAFFRTGGFPFDKDHQRQKWEEDLDSWLVGVAKHVFAQIRFELALVGFEVETARFSKAKIRASPLSERQFEGVLLPSEGQLKWFPPTN